MTVWFHFYFYCIISMPNKVEVFEFYVLDMILLSFGVEFFAENALF